MSVVPVRLRNLVTWEELQQAKCIYKECRGGVLAAHRICDQIIRPNIDRINRDTGRESRPMYIAAMVVAVLYLSSRIEYDEEVLP